MEGSSNSKEIRRPSSSDQDIQQHGSSQTFPISHGSVDAAEDVQEATAHDSVTIFHIHNGRRRDKMTIRGRVGRGETRRSVSSLGPSFDDEDDESVVEGYANEKDAIIIQTEESGVDIEDEFELPTKPRERLNQYTKTPQDTTSIYNDPRSVSDILSKEELENSSPIESRLSIHEEYLFKILPTNNVDNDEVASFFQAISQAISGTTTGSSMFKKEILEELFLFWEDYWDDVEECLLDRPDTDIRPPLTPSTSTKVRNYVLGGSLEALMLLLRAAGTLYHFKCLLFTVENEGDHRRKPRASVTSLIPRMPVEPETTLFFLKRWNTSSSSWYYQRLVPIIPSAAMSSVTLYQRLTKDLSKTTDFPVLIYQVIRIDQQKLISPFPPEKSNGIEVKSSNKPILGFALQGRTYFLLPTVAHDLWPLMSDMIMQNFPCSPTTLSLLKERKWSMAEERHWGKVRKGKSTKGITPPNGKAPKTPYQLHRNRDLSDLAKVAEILQFPYVVIGLDVECNKYFWVEKKDTRNQRRLKLFVKMSKGRRAAWHALIEDNASHSLLKHIMAKERQSRRRLEDISGQYDEGEMEMKTAPDLVQDFEETSKRSSLASRPTQKSYAGKSRRFWRKSSINPSTLADSIDQNEGSAFQSEWDNDAEQKPTLGQRLSNSVTAIRKFFKSRRFNPSFSKLLTPKLVSASRSKDSELPLRPRTQVRRRRRASRTVTVTGYCQVRIVKITEY